MCEDGRIRLPEEVRPSGRTDVIVTFFEQEGEVADREQEPGRRLVSRWSGVLEGVDADRWEEQRAEDLERKHS